MKSLWFFLFLGLSQIGFGQFSVSVTTSYKYEGTNLWHKSFGIESRWEKEGGEVAVGICYTRNSIDYLSHKEMSSYSHGPPGYSDTWTDMFDYSAKVTYNYLSLYLSKDWAMIESSHFKLFGGFHLQPEFLVLEKESEHVTRKESRHFSDWAGEGKFTVQVFPQNETEFNALNMRKFSVLIGGHLSPRLILDPLFFQMNLGFGIRSNSWYEDAQEYCNSGACLWDKNAKGIRMTFVPSIGLSVGYVF